jgi:hypothetical protein
MVLEGLAAVDANVIATVGHDLDPADFGPQPPHVRVECFISQALILPHCSAMLARRDRKGDSRAAGCVAHEPSSCLESRSAGQSLMSSTGVMSGS